MYDDYSSRTWHIARDGLGDFVWVFFRHWSSDSTRFGVFTLFHAFFPSHEYLRRKVTSQKMKTAAATGILALQEHGLKEIPDGLFELVNLRVRLFSPVHATSRQIYIMSLRARVWNDFTCETSGGQGKSFHAPCEGCFYHSCRGVCEDRIMEILDTKR